MYKKLPGRQPSDGNRYAGTFQRSASEIRLLGINIEPEDEYSRQQVTASGKPDTRLQHLTGANP